MVFVGVMIGIPAYNEEENIEMLLSFLVQDCINYVDCIYVVSSGSTDKTNEIVESYSKKYSKIVLIVENERKGKAYAVNNLLTSLEKNHEVLVLMGADNLPEEGAVRMLIDEMKKGGVDAVAGRPIPLNYERTLMGFFSHMLWNLHHILSLEKPKLSGELMSIKKGGVVEIPPTIINDDQYIQSILETKEYNVKYCPEIKIFLRGPENIRDFIKQRRRIFTGHKQIESLLGKSIPTMKLPTWGQFMKARPYNGIKTYFYTLLFIFFQGLAHILSKWDFNNGNLHYKWDMVESSKNLF